MGIGFVLQRLRSILGADIDLIEVGLERQKPRNIVLYREKLSRKVSFGRRVNSLQRLPAELYFANNPQGDDRLFRLMDLQCRSLRPDRSETKDFAEELKEFILTASENSISLAKAADYFHVSERTLQPAGRDRHQPQRFA